MYYKFEKRPMAFYASPKLKFLSSIPHIHQHLELVYLQEGSSLATADTKTALLQAGDVYLAFPNQIHYYETSPVKGILIIIEPELFPDLMHIFTSKLPDSPIIHKDQLPEDINRQLLAICEYNRSDDPLMKVVATSHMQGILAQLLIQMKLVDKQSTHDNVRDILTYCFDNYKEPLSLDRLAQELHMSKYYISHIFSDRLNISFPDFINGLRIESALRRLDKGKDITDVAFESGFNSIRSFNRNFKESTGLTPTEYIKQKKSNGKV